MPEVSVIVPTFNRAKIVPKAIDSVIQQTYRDYEIIVIDDGSTDNTKTVLRKYDDKIVYRYKENGGISSARSSGIEIAKGNYIALLDSDDFWLKNKLEKQMTCFKENASYGMVATRCSSFDIDGDFDTLQPHGCFIGSAAVAFGCPYQGDVFESDIFKIIDSYLSRGATTVILADTTGMATPIRVEQLVKKVLGRAAGIDVALHLHNNRGTAMTNLFAAMMAGATVFDTALGGIGGCPYVPQAAGNLPTEDVVFMLEDMGVDTGIDLEAIIRAAHRLEKIMGYALPGQVMKSGPRDPKRAAELCGVGAGAH